MTGQDDSGLVPMIYIMSYRKVGWMFVEEWETLGIYHNRDSAEEARERAEKTLGRVEFRLEVWDVRFRIGRLVYTKYY